MAGDDSGKVTIWNMAPVQNEEDEMNENVPKLLCQMDNHLGKLSFLINSIQHLILACTCTCTLICSAFKLLHATRKLYKVQMYWVSIRTAKHTATELRDEKM